MNMATTDKYDMATTVDIEQLYFLIRPWQIYVWLYCITESEL